MQNHPGTIVTDKGKQIGIILSGSFAGFMVLLDSNIVNIALPFIGKYFNIGTSLVVHITLVYLLVLSGMMIIAGKLADRIGIKRIFISGFIIFTASSLMCGLSTSFTFLIVARAIQAVGGAMLIVTTLTLVTRFIPAEKRGWSFGILTPVNSLGVLVGAPLGGLITGYLDWHWIFLINIPVGIAAIIVAHKVIPDDSVRKGGKNPLAGFDYPGAILSFLGLALVVFFLNQAGRIGWASPVTYAGLGASIGCLILFYYLEKRNKDPLLDMSIFRSRNFFFAILASFLGYGLMSGNSVLMPFYLEYMMHIRVEYAGFLLMIFPLVFSLLSPVTGRLSDKVSKPMLTSSGMIMACISCIFFLWFLPEAHIWIVVLFLVLMGFSYSMFITPNNNLVMSLAPEGKQSVTSSVFRLSTNMGQLFGVLIMEAMFTLCLPSSSQPTSAQLKQASQETLLTGFQYSYFGGGILVLLAFLTTRLTKASPVSTRTEMVPEM